MPENEDTNDLNRLYESNYAALLRFARRFIDDEAAKDAVQDVFTELWENGRARCDDPSVRAYLFACVRNRCLNILKHIQIEEDALAQIQTENRLLELDLYDSPETLLINDENLQQISQQIDRLPEKCQNIFKLAYNEGKKSAEIAKIFNLSVRTVEHQLYLGLKNLRKKLRPS